MVAGTSAFSITLHRDARLMTAKSRVAKSVKSYEDSPLIWLFPAGMVWGEAGLAITVSRC